MNHDEQFINRALSTGLSSRKMMAQALRDYGEHMVRKKAEKPEHIGRSIRLLRIRHNYTQGEMARLLSCSTSTWSGYEVGRTPVPDDVIKMLMHHFAWDGLPIKRTPDEIAEAERLRESIEGIFE